MSSTVVTLTKTKKTNVFLGLTVLQVPRYTACREGDKKKREGEEEAPSSVRG